MAEKTRGWKKNQPLGKNLKLNYFTFNAVRDS